MAQAMLSSMPRAALIIEFLLLFVAGPAAYRFSPTRIPALPLLWIASGYAWWRLIRDPHFDRTRLWNAGQLPGHLAGILITFTFTALFIWVGVHRFAPEREWRLVRRNPAFWAAVMAAYPALSVYPQGVLYRAFFFERYRALFPRPWTMIVASAAAFAFMHIIFRNRLAVGLSLAGGLLFALRYAETGSLATSCLEHALYGCWLFTVGLGEYFYYGAIPTFGAEMGAVQRGDGRGSA